MIKNGSTAIVCFILFLGSSFQFQKERIHIGQNDTFEAARKSCSNLGAGYKIADLSLDSHSDLQKSLVNDYWLPFLRVVYDKYIWADGTSADTSLNSLGFALGFPCGAIDLENGHYDFLPCNQVGSAFLCQIPGCRTCHSIQKSTYECNAMGNNCFTFHCGSGNWYQARETCIRQGGDLAVIKDKKEISSFYRFWDPSYQSPCSTAWIGVYREKWLTNEGEEPTTSFWGDGEPGNHGNCSIISLEKAEYVWRAVSCHDRYRYHCIHRDKTQVNQTSVQTVATKTRTTAVTEGNLNIAIFVSGVVLIIVFLTAGIFRSACRTRNRNTRTHESSQTALAVKPRKPLLTKHHTGRFKSCNENWTKRALHANVIKAIRDELTRPRSMRPQESKEDKQRSRTRKQSELVGMNWRSRLPPRRRCISC